MKKGFTLIELLAVIVILAIIALIATPIILNIINDAKKESRERSAELYLNGVELAVARKNLSTEFSPTQCDILTDGNLMCAGTELTVEVDGEVPTGGTIEFVNNKATKGTLIFGEEFTATVNEGKVVIGSATQEETGGETGIVAGQMSSVCNPLYIQVEGQYTAGDEYECDVDPNKEGNDYTFYVLTTVTDPNATSVNLIMDSNLNNEGQAVKGEVTNDGLVMWANWGDNSYGPFTAMNYLSSATSTWTNVNLQTISTFDNEGESAPIIDVIIDDNGESYVEKTYSTYARMPYLSEVSDYSASANNAYLYNNLSGEDYTDQGGPNFHLDVEGLEHISNVFGYWTLSSNPDSSEQAWTVYSWGSLTGITIYNPEVGVRPVINLSI